MTATREVQRTTKPVRRLGDRVFSGSARGAGILLLVILAGVAAFLVVEAVPALHAPASQLPGHQGITAYIWPLLFGTLVAAVIALLIGAPLAVAIALFIAFYAPRRLAQALGYLVDLLAAIPSVVFGFWGISWLAPRMVPFYQWLEHHLGFLPLFTGPASVTGRTMFTAGLVLAVMILPIISAIAREVFRQAPALHREAALALGATRWEMIRMAVLPYGRSGIIGGAMLGLGRALGETIAVLLILSTVSNFSPSLFSGGQTFASKIAGSSAEFGANPGPYIAAGLVLFVLTFVVNAAARMIVSRRKEFS